MKNKIYAIVKLTFFIIILSICLIVVYNITKRKYSYQKTENFFAQEENFDVLFFGSSHMFNTIYPMQLWSQYGINSYNMGSTSATLAISYYNILMACKEKMPKLIVLDTFRIEKDYKVYPENFTNSMHNTFDPYPLSYEKYLAINDLCDEENLIDNMMEFLFNFSIYHSRWNELKEEDFRKVDNCEKGAEYNIRVFKPNTMSEFNSVDIFSGEETINMQYLRKIIEFCQANNIEILVTYFPHPATDLQISVSKYVETICDEYNVNYINFLNANLIDYNIDFYDADSHLNVSGGRKVTNYLGQYIIDNYNITDQRKNKNYSFWDEDYNKYIDLKISYLDKNKDDLNNYLMLLYDENDIEFEIKISSKRVIEDKSIFQMLLANLKNNYEVDDSCFKEHQGKTVKITTYDKRYDSEIATVWF